jgi:hypothetical protein
MFCRSLLAGLVFLAAAVPSFAQEDSLLTEWRVLTAQNELIKGNAPYLVMDGALSSLTLKLGNAIVWTMKEDSGTAPLNVARMVQDFTPYSALLFAVERIRLMEYEPRFPDSLLKIVSEAMDMDPSLLQREIPVVFEIKWRNGPTLLVHSKPENDPVKIEVPFREKLGMWINSFNGPDVYTVQTDREVALTLYRVSKNGALTLVLR